MLRTVAATRYVTPLREGGSLPAIIEASDDGLYVLKFQRAGQGPRALVAELVVGELARALGLPVPELVLCDLDVALGRAEPDPEIQDLVVGSAGRNLALDYLPGSVTFNVAADRAPAPELAAAIVWLDSLVTNPDRMPQNPNLLMWHDELWLIDHGAALYVHHGWNDADTSAKQRFDLVSRHVLLPVAGDLLDADAALAPKVTREALAAILADIPDEWLADDPHGRDAQAQREAYIDWFLLRLDSREAWLTTAEQARRAALAGTATIAVPHGRSGGSLQGWVDTNAKGSSRG